MKNPKYNAPLLKYLPGCFERKMCSFTVREGTFLFELYINGMLQAGKYAVDTKTSCDTKIIKNQGHGNTREEEYGKFWKTLFENFLTIQPNIIV